MTGSCLNGYFADAFIVGVDPRQLFVEIIHIGPEFRFVTVLLADFPDFSSH